MTWQIGNLKLKSRVVQAPMAGYTDCVWRRLIRRFGAELAYIEMLSSEAYIRNSRQSVDIIRRTPDDEPTGAQIMGARANVMTEAARMLEGEGFPLIDINFGCPARKVVRHGGGSAALADEKRFTDILHSVTKSVSIPVTIKVRIGFDVADDAGFVKLLKIAENEGVSAVTVHGRTQKQMYKGASDPSPIQLAKSILKCPVIGNGDVIDGRSALELIKKTGCDAVMIGRATIGNPWIFRDATSVLEGHASPASPTLSEVVEIAKLHVCEMCDWYGEKFGILRMRKIIPHYFKSFPAVGKFRKKAVLLKKQSEIIELMDGLREELLS